MYEVYLVFPNFGIRMNLKGHFGYNRLFFRYCIFVYTYHLSLLFGLNLKSISQDLFYQTISNHQVPVSNSRLTSS